MSTSDRWLSGAADFMPPLDGPAGVAERLLLHVHYGIDWQDGWVGRYRRTYWDQLLPDRVITATYRSQTLRDWWCDIADELGTQPRNAGERRDLERLLRSEHTDRAVLEVLRTQTEALLLRTRIVTETIRQARPTKSGAPA